MYRFCCFFTRAARDPTLNDACDPLPKMVGSFCFKGLKDEFSLGIVCCLLTRM